ncbi:MAG: hypothetical protein JW969_18915 [Spirochaetales bacterium]|nr:hypothetical protein [Spirochaetales bacterium]
MKKYLLFCMLFLFAFSLFCQQVTDDSFIPFVTKLKAVISGTGIVLTWQYPPGQGVTKLIYRYREEIDEKNFNQATLIASLNEDVESYVDHPHDTFEYYYLVLLRDRKGKTYEIFIPFRNKTLLGVSLEKVETEQDLATKITNIKASAAMDTITVSFSSTKPDREVLLYRSTSPILMPDDVLQSTSFVLVEKGKTEYKDQPIPGIDYYYAVFDTALFKIGDIKIEPGKNTTLSPVKIDTTIRTGLPDVKSKRPIPLPYLSLDKSIESDKDLMNLNSFILPSEQKIKPGTEEAVKRLEGSVIKRSEEKTEFQILEVDKSDNPEGDAYILQIIIEKNLYDAKLTAAEGMLKDFLRIRHKPEISERANFYLGQVYYMQGKYKEAFLTFNLCTGHYYIETQSWLQACYEKILE